MQKHDTSIDSQIMTTVKLKTKIASVYIFQEASYDWRPLALGVKYPL